MTRTEFDAACASLEVAFTISQTSGRRTQERNDRVGGSASSWHLLGLARDYAWDQASTKENRLAFESWCDRLGLHYLDEGDHHHIRPKG